MKNIDSEHVYNSTSDSYQFNDMGTNDGVVLLVFFYNINLLYM